jgi:Fe-S oxidoreductase
LPFLQPAVITKEKEKLDELRGISQEFMRDNIRQAEELEAKAVVTVCSACEPNYSELKDTTKLEILHYQQFLAHFFEGGKLNL